MPVLASPRTFTCVHGWCWRDCSSSFPGLLLAATSIGPAFGFVTGAVMQRFFVDIDKFSKGDGKPLLTKRTDAKCEMPPLRSSSFLRVYSGRREDQLFPAVSPQTLIHKDKWPKNLRLQMRSWTQQEDQIHLKYSSKLQNPDEFRVSDVSVRRWVAPQTCEAAKQPSCCSPLLVSHSTNSSREAEPELEDKKIQ